MRCILLLFLVNVHSGSFGEMQEKPDTYCEGLPPAQPLWEIKPTVYVSTGGRVGMQFTIEYPSDIKETVTTLENRGYLAKDRQVVFIVHGYWNTKTFVFAAGGWMDTIKDEILKRENSTVFVVSWGKGSFKWTYEKAASNTKIVAYMIQSLAESILNTTTFQSNPDNLYLYCIGHSLGAHICGQAGRFSGHFDRVTGLDPAGPCFEDSWNPMHIDKDSATCVDNIDTDGTKDGHSYIASILVWKTWNAAHYGTMRPWGHIDFYPKYGTNQDGCTFTLACSHSKAYEYFIDSINPQNTWKWDARGPCGEPKSWNSCGRQEQKIGYYSSCHKSNNATKQPGIYFSPRVMI